MSLPLVDIHCHLLPGVDDGAADLETSLGMARIAEDSGTGTIIATPHQLGNFAHNRGDAIRQSAAQLQRQLAHCGHQLQVLPGADVRIEDGMVEKIVSGDVLTLGDHGKHVLLELPHELYFPLEGLLAELRERSIVGILSHPERNQGLLRQPELIPPLVDAGCLMQVTAGSFVGAMGDAPREMSEWMLREGLVHVVATDAHGIRSRRPRLTRAYDRIVELAGAETAEMLCATTPAAIACGAEVAAGRAKLKRRGWRQILARKSSWLHPSTNNSGRKAA